MVKRQKLGEMLLAKKIITKEILDTVLKEGARTGKRIGHILIEKEYITNEELAFFLEKQLGIPAVDINKKYKLDSRIFKKLPHKYCVENMIAPLKIEKGNLVIAMADPTNYNIIAEVRFMTEASVDVKLATEKSIMEFIKSKTYVKKREVAINHESNVDSSNTPFDSLNYTSKTNIADDMDDFNEQVLTEMADDAPVVKLVNNIIAEAIEKKASDIHFETYENRIRLLYRIDGILYEMPNSPPISMQPAIISRIKIISKLDISERRLPQDGRVGLEMDGRKIDLRVSIVPAIHGENVVLRILDKGGVLLDLKGLGMEKDEIEMIMNEARRPHGMFLVAGPTGSGKTTTLYAILHYIRTFEKKILTVEDPVEYQLDGVTQLQAHAEIGLDFARGLRAFLRHDPDVIMVGEIRDLETAEIAIRSALTGHLVLSTVHTNDSPSAMTRFIDMGIPPYLVTATFNMVFSQRLVRRICPECRKKIKLTRKKINELGLKGKLKEGSFVYEGKGCKACNSTGYQGRFAVFEIMKVNDKLKDLVVKNASLIEIRNGARKSGMYTLLDKALKKVVEGETTIEEALRISSSEELEYDELF